MARPVMKTPPVLRNAMDSATAQDYKKLLTEAIQKHIVVLGPQITMLKVHNVASMTVTPEGVVTALSDTPQNVITHFLEQFRDLSVPLVKKSMKPLLSVIGTPVQATDETKLVPKHEENHEELVPKT